MKYQSNFNILSQSNKNTANQKQMKNPESPISKTKYLSFQRDFKTNHDVT